MRIGDLAPPFIFFRLEGEQGAEEDIEAVGEWCGEEGVEPLAQRTTWKEDWPENFELLLML